MNVLILFYTFNASRVNVYFRILAILSWQTKAIQYFRLYNNPLLQSLKVQIASFQNFKSSKPVGQIIHFQNTLEVLLERISKHSFHWFMFRKKIFKKQRYLQSFSFSKLRNWLIIELWKYSVGFYFQSAMVQKLIRRLRKIYTYATKPIRSQIIHQS